MGFLTEKRFKMREMKRRGEEQKIREEKIEELRQVLLEICAQLSSLFN